MNWSDTTFKATDVIKIVTFFVLGAIAWATLKGSVGNLGDSINEIRSTQIENSRRNEMRWREQELRLNQIEINQRLFDQRLQQLEQR